MTFALRIRRWLRYPSLTELSASRSVMAQARALIKYYFLFLPVLAFSFSASYATPLAQQHFDALWPLGWASFFSLSPDTTVIIIRLALLAATILGITFYERRWMRIVIFLTIWQAHAFMSSFGQPNHQWYPWLYTSFIFIFLPRSFHDPERHAQSRDLLLIVWWAQASLMLIYSMAGFWKFEQAFVQMYHGQIGGLSEYGFAYQIANWLPQLQHEAIFGPFLIQHPLIAWPMYVASHFFQFFALWVMIRPSLQRLWAYELIVFHVMTYLTMGIDFSVFVPLLIILFFNSPFAPEKTTVRMVIRDFPVFGQLCEAMPFVRTLFRRAYGPLSRKPNS